MHHKTASLSLMLHLMFLNSRTCSVWTALSNVKMLFDLFPCIPDPLIPFQKKFFWEVMASLEHWVSAEVMTMHLSSTPCQNHSATWDVHQLARHVLYVLAFLQLFSLRVLSTRSCSLILNRSCFVDTTQLTVYLRSQVWHQQNGRHCHYHEEDTVKKIPDMDASRPADKQGK